MNRSAFVPADILLPGMEDLTDWSVIACDQFTSERDYWERVTVRTKDKLSTRHMILPETYLNDGPISGLVESINNVMACYVKNGVFTELKNSYVYVERQVSGGVRHGIVGALDLEMYDFNVGSTSAVRASESTVVERLPVREQIRRNALLEMPHIMVLIDDAEKSVVEPLADMRGMLKKVYDFELMENGGRIRGYQVDGAAAMEVSRSIEKLAQKDVQIIIGDGNHSLAAAKLLWERAKRDLPEQERINHPARYVLVELCNVYDEGITFEPIHRVVFNTAPEKLLDDMRRHLGSDKSWQIKCIHDGKTEIVGVRGKSFGSMVRMLEEFLEEYTALAGGSIDYIHDEESLVELTEEKGSIGFVMPVMDKADLFKTVLADGVFPKKSFSIGRARDKRYYLECRKIK